VSSSKTEQHKVYSLKSSQIINMVNNIRECFCH